MAGVSGNPGDVELLDAGQMHRDVIEQLSTNTGTLRDVVAAIRGSVDRGTAWDLPLQGHPRVRASELVLTISGACVVTVTIGSSTRTFNFPTADTRILPFPFVIERGADVSLAASGGVVVSGYLVGWAE